MLPSQDVLSPCRRTKEISNMEAIWKVDYSQNWRDWIDIAKRHHEKDKRLFIPLLRWFPKNAKILEIGAGAGQLSALLKSEGYKYVTASDVEPSFIDYMRKDGIQAKLVDILDIASSSEGITWDVIFSQGASPLITADMKIVERAYWSIYEALSPGGMFVYIGPRYMDPKRYCYPSDHKEIYMLYGFKERMISRQQVLPANLYKYGLSVAAEKLFGRFFGVQDVFVLEKEEMA